MQLFCPACQAVYTAQSHCPKCAARLLSPQESFITGGKVKPPPPDPAPATFPGRLLTGVLVSVGLITGFRELFLAVCLAGGASSLASTNAGNTDPNTFALRLFAVLIGTLLAGAGRRVGTDVGAASGAIAGALVTLLDTFSDRDTSHRTAWLLATAYPLLGAIAGTVGAWLWPADAVLPEPKHLLSHGSSLARLAAEDALRRKQRPTAWFRIAFAATVTIVGVIGSEPIRFALAKYSAGLFNTGGMGMNRSPVLGLQIATILTLLGGGVAGIGTGAGFKHGFYASLLAGAGLFITSTSRPNGLFPSLEGFVQLFDLDPEPLTSLHVGTNVMLALITMMSLAGWVGGQLFPPLAPKHMWKKVMQHQS